MKRVNKQIIIRGLKISMFFITVNSVILFSKYIGHDSILTNTLLWWIISASIVTAFIISANTFYDRSNNKNIWFIILYIAWNIICVIRGGFVSETYWDWKGLIGNAMILMLPVAAIATTNIALTQSLLSFYIKVVLPSFVLFAFLVIRNVWGFYLMPMSILLLFLPALTNKQKTIVIIATALVLFAELGARSNILKFLTPLLFLSFYYLRNIITYKTLEKLRLLLIIIPIVFFVLGVTHVFNIFKIQDYVKGDIKVMDTDGTGSRAEVSLIGDTRTFIFEEVLQSAKKNNYWIMGRTPARGNDSPTFGLIEFQWTGRYERLSNEIGLANVFTWTGIIGVIIYFLIFYQASFLAVNRSNNIFAKILGLYVAFRWLFCWIEDYQNFSINFLLLWIMIGLCISKSFRSMTDVEVTYWIRGVFDVRYIKFQNFMLKKQLYGK